MRQKLGGIERALTLCLYGPTVNGDKGPARSTAQPDDVTAHVPGQLGEAGGLQQERLLGLHGGLRAAAVSHRHHVIGLARSVAPWARLLGGKEERKCCSQFSCFTFFCNKAPKTFFLNHLPKDRNNCTLFLIPVGTSFSAFDHP